MGRPRVGGVPRDVYIGFDWDLPGGQARAALMDCDFLGALLELADDLRTREGLLYCRGQLRRSAQFEVMRATCYS